MPLRLVLAALLGSASTAAVASMAVSPTLIEQSLQPGDNTLEIIVSNTGNEDLEVELSTAPLAHDLNGNAVEGDPHPNLDASRLIRFEKPRFTLKARKWRRIRAHVDGAARGGGASAFIFVRGVRATPDAREKVAVNWRFGVPVTLEFPGRSEKAVAVSDLHIRDKRPRVRVKNTGNIHIRPEGQFVIRNAEGAAVWTGKILPRLVLPNLERDLELDGAPQLPPGNYTAEVALSAPTPARLARAIAQVEDELVVARDSGSP